MRKVALIQFPVRLAGHFHRQRAYTNRTIEYAYRRYRTL